ncbi:HAD-IIB family hydrolase [Jannaschia sp. KMU-145]|uniref:HAD-IIB family hydrolase n=1 Tax=Jannaschia halovivens TaxID=3388667 RepID=UPI00396B0894
MHIVHVAIGGCLTLPNVRYGITDDTGGHIAYILGAAAAQARRPEVSHVDIVTRAFDDVTLGADHGRAVQPAGDGLRILRLRTSNGAYLAKEALAAERPALSEAFTALIAGMARPPEVIHAHFADAAAIVRAAAARFDIPVVYTPHSLGIDKASCDAGRPPAALIRRIALERTALRVADAVIVSSRDEAERQVEGYGIDVAGRTHRVAPGVTRRDGPPGTGQARALIDHALSDPELPMILAIARPVRKKNLAALVRAYLGSPTLGARANLVILAGQRGAGIAQTPETAGVIAELESLARQCPGRIALPERHGPDIVAQAYRLAARRGGVFVNPALHEPFGLTLLEAAEAGLPVVATRNGGPGDILGTLRNGTLVDPDDPEGIGAAIIGLLDDGHAWRAAAEAGQSRLRAFDWDVWADRAARIYADLRRPARSFAVPHALLASDIDGTLTGCRTGAAAFRGWAATRDLPFVVATGRCISEARAVLTRWDLPAPDAFITAVGTELHLPDARGRMERCERYAAAISENWDRAAVLARLAEAGARMQAPVEQRRWKLACLGDASEAERLRAALDRAGLAARVVPSHGRLIDILAPRAGKAAAIRAYAAGQGLDARRCVVAGDSGNDLDMLTMGGTGIVVGNALPELDHLTPGPDLLRTRAHHAGGVLEGLAAAGLIGARAAAEVAA